MYTAVYNVTTFSSVITISKAIFMSWGNSIQNIGGILCQLYLCFVTTGNRR